MTFGTWLEQRFCALRGHQAMLTFDPPRMFLSCHACGWTSSGVTVKPKQKQPSNLLQFRHASRSVWADKAA